MLSSEQLFRIIISYQFIQIWSKWTSSQSNGDADSHAVEGAVGGGVDLSAALASITDTRTKEYAAAKAKTASKGGISADKDVKAAIMAQYAQVRSVGVFQSQSFDLTITNPTILNLQSYSCTEIFKV